MSTQNAFTEYFKNQALASIGYSHSIEQALQTGHGFYKGLPWQKGYGIGGLLGSIARRFVPLLKPLIKTAGKKLLHTGTSIVSDLIDGKPVKIKDTGKNLLRAGTSFVSDIIDGKPDVGHARLKKINRKNKKPRHCSNVLKIRNKKTRCTDSNIIPYKRLRHQQDIFS